jgi:hypothetical protein
MSDRPMRFGTRVLLFWVGVQLAVGFTVPFVAILLALVISTTGALAFQLETPRSDQVTLNAFAYSHHALVCSHDSCQPSCANQPSSCGN